ncbi:MAG: SDR family oxidoreductase [Cyclobacteriaceae bacterium]
MSYTLITGASRGIGEALARYCAKDGHNLILVARSQARLEDLADELSRTYHVSVQVVSLDLLQPQAASHLWQLCQKNKWGVRILVNNAGFGLWGAHSELALNDQTDVLRLNAMVLVELCHHFVPVLQQESDAHILNLGSISSYQPVPYLSMYSATKAFVLSFSRSLRMELKPLGIGVSCLCPGLTQSHFFNKAGAAPILSSERVQMKAEEVAETALRMIKKDQAVAVPGYIYKSCTFLSRYLPVRLTTYVLSKLLKPSVKVKVVSS